MQYPSFVGPSYTSQSPIADCEKLVNLYVERVEAPGGKCSGSYCRLPAFRCSARLVCPAAGRGLFHVNGRSFAVSRLKSL
jgi:hypothetical protein